MSENGYIGKEELTGKFTPRYKDVPLRGGRKTRIRNLSEYEKSNFEADLLSKKGGVAKARLADAARRLVALCVVDGAGNRILSREDVAAMGEADGADIGDIYAECQPWCGFEEGDIEQTVKNSATVTVVDTPAD